MKPLFLCRGGAKNLTVATGVSDFKTVAQSWGGGGGGGGEAVANSTEFQTNRTRNPGQTSPAFSPSPPFPIAFWRCPLLEVLLSSLLERVKRSVAKSSLLGAKFGMEKKVSDMNRFRKSHFPSLKGGHLRISLFHRTYRQVWLLYSLHFFLP